jgi:hypothetical protein
MSVTPVMPPAVDAAVCAAAWQAPPLQLLLKSCCSIVRKFMGSSFLAARLLHSRSVALL